MKNSTLLVAFATLLVSVSSSAQLVSTKHNFKKCYTVEAMAEARRNNPNIETDAHFEAWLQNLVQQRGANRTNTAYTLPIVFHVIYNGEAEGSGLNISQALINSQLNQLNKDFGNRSNSPYAVAANTDIQFAMAQKDPNGLTLAQPGIDRVNRVTKGWTSPGTTGWSTSYITANIKPNTIWDPTKYINIWLAPMSGGILGYATFPSSSTLDGLDNSETNSTAGVVIASASVGSVVNPSTTDCSSNPYNLGRTMTHELGHFFGLRHIWGDATCGDDYVGDTPVHQDENGGVPTHPKPNACGTADEMFENYMDYTDDVILNTFTAGQVARMQTVMFNSPRRKELVTSTAGLVPVPSNKIAFMACAAALTVSEKGTSAAFPWYRDVPVIINIEDKATAAATITINASGTASNGTDYQVLNPSINIAAGDAFKIINVRLLDDGVPESTETITLTYSISGTGVTAAAVNQTFTLTINDDDNIRPGENPITLLNEPFTTAAGWSTLSSSGAVNVWTVSANGNAGGTGNVAHITNNTTSRPNTYTKTATSLAALRSPIVDASGLSNLAIYFKYRIAGEVSGTTAYDYGYVYATPETSPTGIDQVAGTNIYASNTPITGTGNIVIPETMSNTRFYFGFLWNNDNTGGTDPGFNVDDVVLTASGTRIETAVNSSNSFAISPATTNNFKSRTNDKLIARVANASASISQLIATILEAGNDRPTINTQTGTYFRSRKVFQLNPATADNSTTYTATFYFTPAEVAAWGASISTVKILKLNNSANLSGTLSSADGVIVPATIDDKLTTDGYISFTGTFTGFSKFVIVEAATVLPVRLLDFTGTLAGSKVKLNWKTTAETNNSGFEVERSADGTAFTKLGWVTAAANGSVSNSYSFDDISIVKGNRYFYRLKQVDKDNNFSYSPVVNIAYLAGQVINWYPNPVKNILVIQNTGSAKNATIVVSDIAGKVMYTSQTLLSGKVEIPTAAWASGVYNVQLTMDNEPVTFKVVKN